MPSFRDGFTLTNIFPKLDTIDSMENRRLQRAVWTCSTRCPVRRSCLEVPYCNVSRLLVSISIPLLACGRSIHLCRLPVTLLHPSSGHHIKETSCRRRKTRPCAHCMNKLHDPIECKELGCAALNDKPEGEHPRRTRFLSSLRVSEQEIRSWWRPFVPLR